MSGEVSPAASEVSAISLVGEEMICVRANDSGMETIYLKHFGNQRHLFEHRDHITQCNVEFLYARDDNKSDQMPLCGHSFMLDWRLFTWTKFRTTTSVPNKFVVDLSSFNRHTVKALLRFVYCFDLQIKRANVASFFKLLDKFSDPGKTDTIVDFCLNALQEALGDDYLAAIADPEISNAAVVTVGEEVESGTESSVAKPISGVVGPPRLTADETRSIFGEADAAFAGGGNTPATPILFDTPATASVGEHRRRQVDALASYSSPFESSTPLVARRVNDGGINRSLDSWAPILAEARRANEELGLSIAIDDFAQETVHTKIAAVSSSVVDLVSDSEGENPREHPLVNGEHISAHVENYIDGCFDDCSDRNVQMADTDDDDDITLHLTTSSDSDQSDDDGGGAAKGSTPRRATSTGRGGRRRGRKRGHGWSSLGRSSARAKSGTGASEPKVAKPRRSQSVSSCRNRIKKAAPVGKAAESPVEEQQASEETGRGSRRRSKSVISYYESPPSSPKSARGYDSSDDDDDDDAWEERRPPSRGRSATPRLRTMTGYRARLRSRGSVKDASEQEPETVSSNDDETELANGHSEDEETSLSNGDKQSGFVQSTADLSSIMGQLKDLSVIIPRISQANLDSSPNALLAATASEFVAPEEMEDDSDPRSISLVAAINNVAHGSFQSETPEGSGKMSRAALMLKPIGPRLALGQEIIKFQNVTPAPNYAQMPTPILKRALKDNGVRPLPKAKGIIVLNEIYKKNHPVLDEATGSLSELTPEVMKPKPAEKRKRGPRKKAAVNVAAEPNSDGASSSVGVRLGGGGATAESSSGGPKIIKAKRQRKPKPAPAQPQPHLNSEEHEKLIAQRKLTKQLYGKRTLDQFSSDESDSDDDGFNNSGCGDTELNKHARHILDLLRERSELSPYYAALQSNQRVELRAMYKDLNAADYKISLELLADILDVSGYTYKLDGQRGRYKKLVRKRRGNAETQQPGS